MSRERPRIEYDPVLKSEVQLTYDKKGLMVTFGSKAPTETGGWGAVLNAIRTEAIHIYEEGGKDAPLS